MCALWFSFIALRKKNVEAKPGINKFLFKVPGGALKMFEFDVNSLFFRRYYKETDGLKLDVGVYMKALEVYLFKRMCCSYCYNSVISLYIGRSSFSVDPASTICLTTDAVPGRFSEPQRGCMPLSKQNWKLPKTKSP